jgi:hypothetical protein
MHPWLPVSKAKVMYKGTDMRVPTCETGYRGEGETFFPSNKIIPYPSEDDMNTKLFVAEDMPIHGIPDSPKNGEENK